MSNKPPIPLPEIKESILTAIREFDWQKARPVLAELVGNTPAYMERHFALEHTTPSPSSAIDCRRQLWCKTHLAASGHTRPESWDYAAAIGMLVEPWWMMMLHLADERLKVDVFENPLDIIPGIQGMPDGDLKALGALFELKSSGGWDYIYVNEEGVYKQHADRVAQANLYLEGADKEWCLILHNTVAPALVRWIKAPYLPNRGGKDPNSTYPFFNVEWIQRDPELIVELKEGLQLRQEDQLNDEPALRTYNPQTTKWPCQKGCSWRTQCEEIG